MSPLVAILAIIIIIVVIVFAVVLFNFSSNGNAGIKANPFVPTWNDSTLGEIEINEGVIGYVLFQLGAYDLHNPPLSSKTPKIEVVVDNEIFSAEVNKGIIMTTKGAIDEEDIRIYMTRTNVINIINSTVPADTIQNAINEGNMSFEQVASKITLFSKGYLSLYIKFTGEKVDISEEEA